MKQIFIKKILPHLLVIIGFWLFSLAYFPVDFSKERIRQSDIVHWQGGTQEISNYNKVHEDDALWTNSMFAGMPSYGISTVFPNNLTKKVTYILNPFNMKSQAYRLFLSLISFYILMCVLGVSPLLAFVGSIGFGLSTYFYIIESVGHNSKAYTMAYMPLIVSGILLVYKRNKMLLGASLFGLFFSLQNGAGHPQIVYYTGLMVLCLGFTYLYFYIKNNAVKEFFIKSGILVVFALLSVMCNFSHTFTNYEYAKHTIRGKSELSITPNGKTDASNNKTSGLDRDYINAYSYTKLETFNLFIPGLMGGSSGYNLYENGKRGDWKAELTGNKKVKVNRDSHTYQYVSKKYGEKNAQMLTRGLPMYWGQQPFTEGPVYIGAVLVFLFILALITTRGPTLIWVLSSTVLCFVLAWGKHFSIITDLFIDYFPLYNKFRTVSMILVIAEFTIPFFAIYGLHKLLKRDKEFIFSSVKKAIYVAGGICLFFILFAGSFDYIGLNDAAYMQRFQSMGLDAGALFDNIRLDREALMRSDSIRSLIFVLLSAAGILLYVKVKTVKKQYLFAIIAVLVLADLWPMAKSHLSKKNFVSAKQIQKPYPVQNYDLQILSTELKDESIKKKLLVENKEKLKGLNQNDQYIKLLQELNFLTNYRVLNLSKAVMTDASTSFLHKSLGGYSAVKLRKYQDLWDFHLAKMNPAVINMLNTKYIIQPNKEGKANAILNPSALGNAWFVDNIKEVENADKEILALSSFEPSRTAIVRKNYATKLKDYQFSKSDSAKIVMTKYSPNVLEYQSSSDVDNLAVFSEIYYSAGWKAYVDGKETEIYPVNYLLRSIKVPKGNHKIEMKFHPTVYFVGNSIDLISSSLLLLIIAFAIFMEVKNYRIQFLEENSINNIEK
jgi:hypothetical protein